MPGERYLNMLGATCAAAVLLLVVLYERTGSTTVLLWAGGLSLVGLTLDPLWRRVAKRGTRG